MLLGGHVFTFFFSFHLLVQSNLVSAITFITIYEISVKTSQHRREPSESGFCLHLSSKTQSP